MIKTTTYAREVSSTYVYGGTTTLGRKNKAGYLLQWRILEELKKLGYAYADFEGLIDERLPSTVVTYGGFSHFKERYNPIVVEFPLPYVKLLSPVLKMLRRIYGNAVNI
jgi:lipid II:glycine glycyltransferase (peptidoglycan interpeptide bridge formation enzyme)